MVFNDNFVFEEKFFNVKQVEDILVILLKFRDSKLVQDRLFEVMVSFYGNGYFLRWLSYVEVKKIFTGLIIMVFFEVQEYFIGLLISLCFDEVDIWYVIKKREGIQFLILLLGLFSE